MGKGSLVLAVLLAAISSTALAGAAFDVVEEARAGAVLEATLRVYDRTLDKESALKYLQEFSAEHPRRVGLLKLLMFTNAGDARQYGRPRQVKKFQDWLEMAKTVEEPFGDIAEVLRSPKGTLLRLRSRNAQIQRLVIEGEDPSIIRKGKSAFEILHLVIMPPAPLYRDKPGGGRRVEIYFLAKGDLNREDCQAVTDELSERLDLPYLIFEFRRDPFFVFSETFPILDPLIQYPELPSEETYKNNLGIDCGGVMYGQRHCSTAFRQ